MPSLWYVVLTGSVVLVYDVSLAVSLSSYPIVSVPLYPSESHTKVALPEPSTADTLTFPCDCAIPSIALTYCTFTLVESVSTFLAVDGFPYKLNPIGNVPVPVKVTVGVIPADVVIDIAELSPFDAFVNVHPLLVTIPFVFE